jgi:putative heme-binding domain-containing protein
LEFRSVDAWKARALSEPDARTAITALMALARQGSPDDLDNVLKALDEIDFAKLSDYDQLAVTRVYSLAFIRLAKPSDEWRQKLIAKFDPLFPATSEQLNAELVQLLVYLQSPSIIQKSLAHMETLGPDTPPVWSRLTGRSQRYGGTVQAMIDNMPPVRAIHYALVLRTAKAGWTTALRRKYFEFFTEAAKHSGGSSYQGFLAQIRDEAYEGVPAADRIALDDIVSVPLGAKPFNAIPPVGPGRKWTREEALAALGPELNRRNFDRGRNLFHATSCAKCHHFAGEGGAIGPDLSTAGRKFSLADLMDAIIEPSKAISDQYGSHVVLTDQGQTFNGRVVDLGNELQIYLQDPNAKPVVVKKANVEEMKVSLVSQMPVGLVDSLNEEELKDLIAYILSSGNKKARYYRP